MSYGIAIGLNTGLIFCSDSRAPGGIDRTGTYGRMFHHGVTGQRQLMVVPAGHPVVTQAVTAQLKRDIREQNPNSLAQLGDLYDTAHYLGEIATAQQQNHRLNRNSDHPANFIIGGQIQGSRPEIARVDALGNYTTAPPERPFLQIGDSAYGQALLERLINASMSLENAARCALLAMDSAMHADSAIGPPIDLITYFNDSYAIQHFHFEQGDTYLRALSDSWDQHLAKAFTTLPALSWQKQVHDVQD